MLTLAAIVFLLITLPVWWPLLKALFVVGGMLLLFGGVGLMLMVFMLR